MTSILVVEDEETLAESLRYNLAREGYEVTVVADGRLAVEYHRRRAIDLVVLDLMLPGLGGLDVLRQIRSSSDVPVVVVTAKDAEADVVAGLELGADDYVTKPFSMRELISRIRGILRRASRVPRSVDSLVFEGGPVSLDVDRHEVRIDGELVDFRPKEFELLEALLARKGRLVPRQILLEEIWGVPFFGDPKTLDVHIRRLREKVEQTPRSPEWIVTVRGLGYKFADDR
ncbi:MAG: response regulator transcription factor [bacterium]|nr:response regulator transcription factor [bacterium]MDE0288333.1 response regulator transcription factor [bacterium]MDE0437870.1 response regulator transcription factor [bacterium]